MSASTAQLDFGLNADSENAEPRRWLNLPDADVTFFDRFFSPAESESVFRDLLKHTNWRQEKIRIFGKHVNLPRLTAWYGDTGRTYAYSGISMRPEPWTATLLQIREKVNEASQVSFNSVLLSLYRTGQDSLSWHQDNEPELGENPVIASVSFGDTRSFQFKHKYRKELNTVSISLTHGSLLIMKGMTQRFWVHQVPKTARQVGPRINLTFRVIRDY